MSNDDLPKETHGKDQGQHIGDHDKVDVSEDGPENSGLREPHHLTIFVDGEPYLPPRRTMTPNEIIEDAAKKDPATNYLRQLTPHGPINYKDKGDVPIHLRNDEKFQVICTGPTPVSDSQMRTGVAAFIDGLRALGYEPAQVPDRPDCVVIDYAVPTGKFVGRQVKLGFIVPQNFPMQAPTGPHISPEIHPINPQGPHPTGHVYKAQAQPFEVLGGGWQYWSRPHPNWAKSKRNTAAYMAHILQLWDSQ